MKEISRIECKWIDHHEENVKKTFHCYLSHREDGHLFFENKSLDNAIDSETKEWKVCNRWSRTSWDLTTPNSPDVTFIDGEYSYFIVMMNGIDCLGRYKTFEEAKAIQEWIIEQRNMYRKLPSNNIHRIKL